jgi:hypothetical protein
MACTGNSTQLRKKESCKKLSRTCCYSKSSTLCRPGTKLRCCCKPGYPRSTQLSWCLRFSTQKSTFHDFLAVGRHLVDAGYTSREGLAVWGRSAGGLTLGASLNMDPGVSPM